MPSPLPWNKINNGATYNASGQRAVVNFGPPLTLEILRTSLPPISLTFAPRDAQTNVNGHSLILGDSYTRESDLVAIFPECPPFHFGYQVYFCSKEPMLDAMRLELWLSVQTSTLESHPQLSVSVDGTSLTRIDANRIATEDQSFGILVHPLDSTDFSFDGSSAAQSIVAFGRFMEKGVIRRMRIQIVASERGMSTRDWSQLMESFANSPLPLTA